MDFYQILSELRASKLRPTQCSGDNEHDVATHFKMSFLCSGAGSGSPTTWATTP